MVFMYWATHVLQRLRQRKAKVQILAIPKIAPIRIVFCNSKA